MANQRLKLLETVLTDHVHTLIELSYAFNLLVEAARKDDRLPREAVNGLSSSQQSVKSAELDLGKVVDMLKELVKKEEGSDAS